MGRATALPLEAQRLERGFFMPISASVIVGSPCIPWLMAVALQSLPPCPMAFSSLCLCVSPLFIRILVIGFRGHPDLVQPRVN